MERRDAFIGLGLAMLLALCSFLASGSPDGLERVAIDKNFIHRSVAMVKAPFPDYQLPGTGLEKSAVSLAGSCGVMLVFVLAMALARLLKEDK